MYRLVQVAQGVHKLESTTSNPVFIDSTGARVKLARIKSNLFIALVKAPVKVYKRDCHEYHKQLKAQASRALRDGDAIASSQWLQGTPVTTKAVSNMEAIEQASMQFIEWLE